MQKENKIVYPHRRCRSRSIAKLFRFSLGSISIFCWMLQFFFRLFYDKINSSIDENMLSLVYESSLKIMGLNMKMALLIKTILELLSYILLNMAVKNEKIEYRTWISCNLILPSLISNKFKKSYYITVKSMLEI